MRFNIHATKNTPSFTHKFKNNQFRSKNNMISSNSFLPKNFNLKLFSIMLSQTEARSMLLFKQSKRTFADSSLVYVSFDNTCRWSQPQALDRQLGYYKFSYCFILLLTFTTANHNWVTADGFTSNIQRLYFNKPNKIICRMWTNTNTDKTGTAIIIQPVSSQYNWADMAMRGIKTAMTWRNLVGQK